MALIALLCITQFSCSHKTKPNIIFINIDDLGWADVDYNGNSSGATPHIDALAKQGMIFTQAYAPASNCTPSRACSQTGLYPPRHGIYTVGSSERGESRHRKLIPIKNTLHLADSFLTMAEMLRQAGYATCHAGKWHLSADPRTQGYDVNIAGCEWGNPQPGGGYFGPFSFPGLPSGDSATHLSEIITRSAIHFIGQHRNKPFFVYYAPYLVHTPLQATDSLIRKYQQLFPLKSKRYHTYFAMIEQMDKGVGEILAALKQYNLVNNTLVVFTSDNGGVHSLASQAPLRAGKGSYYEGGIREPFIACWPSVIEAGLFCNQPVSAIDLMKTFREVAGLPIETEIHTDGMSLLPWFKNPEKDSLRPLFWHFPIYLEGGDRECTDSLFRTRPGSAVRYSDWKLIHNYEDNSFELYNLASDISEQQNLFFENHEKGMELLGILNTWRRVINAPEPTTQNPEFQK